MLPHYRSALHFWDSLWIIGGLGGWGGKARGRCLINIHSSIPVDFKQIDQALKPRRDQFGLNQQASLWKWTESKKEADRWLKDGEEKSISFVGRTDGWVDPWATDNCSCGGQSFVPSTFWVFSSSSSPQCYLISSVLWSLLVFLNGRSVSSSHPVVLASAQAHVQYLAIN